VGSVALDTIHTPWGSAERTLGGSASYAALASRLFAPTSILGVVGADFPDAHLQMFAQEEIDASAVVIVKDGKTFFWEGRYHEDMNTRDSLCTEINVLGSHHPDVPARLAKTPFLFLANTDPELQVKSMSQCTGQTLVLADTMNLWIETKREATWALVSKSDVFVINDSEARMLCDTPSLVRAGQRLLEAGAGRVIIKKGEHGCLMMTRDTLFAAPGHPLEEVRDPTGAGDSFAGAYLGYLAQAGSLSEETHRQAVIVGTAVASYNCEAFGTDRLRALTRGEVHARCLELHALTACEAVRAPVPE
jgi:sugar/nucleoside kinase (ribokinase family)